MGSDSLEEIRLIWWKGRNKIYIQLNKDILFHLYFTLDLIEQYNLNIHELYRQNFQKQQKAIDKFTFINSFNVKC